ncbi:ATP/GTP-binding protein [Nocardia sp. R6R-6]|uniref:ATP/GTP-binding protein n=1 Tax=Nocardia sp. R6R-6 TaxID=3459303 RepID=UPI00403DA933
MASENFDSTTDTPLPPKSAKILISGGFGVGKTTMVSSISEVPPLRTEELLTDAGAGVDDLTGIDRKTTTTVALDFGRITIDGELVVYLFGTPGQDRFWFLWDELSRGALGAVILVDPRRLENSFPAIDYFERRAVPFVIGVNCFDTGPIYTTEEVHTALDLDAGLPVLLCDARRRDSAKDLLLTLVEHLMAQLELRHQGAGDASNQRR